ncbi:hypothetical protein HYW59_00270 [Candidatus Kaiserbacteria bacterium]|nr:hypothetical protein [Candidatus Kaiserbacteria bacterium]
MKRRRRKPEFFPLSRPRNLALAVSILIIGGLAVAGVAETSRVGQYSAASAKSGTCEPRYKQCTQDPYKDPYTCELEFQRCVLEEKKCSQKINLGKDNYRCNDNADCQIHCTESWKSNNKSGTLTCCKGDAKHVNKCRDEVDGKCITGPGKGTPKQPKPPEGQQKGQGEGKGGMPELPKPPQKQPKPESPSQGQQNCQQNPSSPECKQAQQPFYCSIPGASYVSSNCSAGAETVQRTADGDKVEDELANFAKAPEDQTLVTTEPSLRPSSPSPLPIDSRLEGEERRLQTAQPPESEAAPPPAGTYVPQEFSGFNAPSPAAVSDVPQAEKAVAWWSLEGLKNGLRRLLDFLPG